MASQRRRHAGGSIKSINTLCRYYSICSPQSFTDRKASIFCKIHMLHRYFSSRNMVCSTNIVSLNKEDHMPSRDTGCSAKWGRAQLNVNIVSISIQLTQTNECIISCPGYFHPNKNIRVNLKCPRLGWRTTLRDAHAIAAVIASRDVYGSRRKPTAYFVT